MKTRKAKAPDPGAYGEDDITPEDRKRAKDIDGSTTPSWVADADVWSKAKEAAAQTYDEGDAAYWPAVVHIYGNLGGAVKSAKAEHHHADMADVVGMMSEYGMTDADMAEASGLDAARVKALLHGGEKPTADELTAMTDACEDCAEEMDKSFEWVNDTEFDEDESIAKHGEHDQSTHAGGGGGGKKPSGGKGKSPKTAIRTSARAAGALARDLANPEHARIAESLEGHLREAAETGSKATLNRASAQLNRLARVAGTSDKNVARSIARIKDNIASAKGRKTKKSANIVSESLLKAELGMSDGEFRRLLSQAVYARWGKQAEVDEVFPETQVAIVKVWEGEIWASALRRLSVPYDAEDGTVTLGEVSGEVRQTYEPVAKSEDGSAASASEMIEFEAERTPDGEYAIAGLNGEAELLRKAVEEVGCKARVEDVNGMHRLVFSRDGLRGERLMLKAEVEGDADSQRFVPYLRDERMLRKAEEKGIVYAIVYAPDEVDKQGEWATADDIEEAAHDYLKRSRRMKRQHDEHSDSEVVESYIAPADFVLGNRVVRKGSWVIAEKLGQKSLALYKAGKLTGVSMGGSCEYSRA